MVKDSTPRDKKFDIILVLTLNMSLIMQVMHLPHTHVVNIKLIVCDSRITKSFLFVDKFYLGLFSFFSSFIDNRVEKKNKIIRYLKSAVWWFDMHIHIMKSFPDGSDSKESACNARDTGSIPGSGNLLEKRMATHSIIFAWKNPWTNHGVTKSWTQLSN